MLNLDDKNPIQAVTDACKLLKIYQTSLMTNTSTVDVSKQLLIWVIKGASM